MQSVRPQQLVSILKYQISHNNPTFVWGPPGIGKSEIAAQVAADLGMYHHDFRLLLRDAVDMRGIPIADGDVTRWLRPSDLPFEGSDFPDETLLFMDELNTAAPSLQTVGFGLVQERRIGEWKLKPGVRIVAAGNRQSDRGAAQKMPTPLANRFDHFELTPHVDDWAQRANAIGVPPVFVAFLRFRPELLFSMEGSDLRAFPTPRSWTRAAQKYDAPKDMRQALIAASVGDGPAGECEAFISMYETLPPIASLIADPKGAMVPTEPSMRYAVAVALGRAATRQNFEAVLTYARRLPKEFAIVLVIDGVKRDASLLETKAFIAWATNQDVSL